MRLRTSNNILSISSGLTRSPCASTIWTRRRLSSANASSKSFAVKTFSSKNLAHSLSVIFSISLFFSPSGFCWRRLFFGRSDSGAGCSALGLGSGVGAGISIFGVDGSGSAITLGFTANFLFFLKRAAPGKGSEPVSLSTSFFSPFVSGRPANALPSPPKPSAAWARKAARVAATSSCD